MSHFYLIHAADENDIMKDTITPLLKSKEVKYNVINIDQESKIKAFEEGTEVIIFLSDKDIKKILPMLFNRNITVGFLPHPEMFQTKLSFGISPKFDEAIDNIINCEKPLTADFLFCNNEPVLNMVKIGKCFSMFSKKSIKLSIINRIIFFFSEVRKMISMRHHIFKIETLKGKEIETSGLGVAIFQHGCSQVFSRVTIDDTTINDGMMYALVLSPRSIFAVLKYFFSNLFLKNNNNKKLPDFIGHVKSESLMITLNKTTEYKIDGILEKNDKFELRLEKKVIKIIPGVFFVKDGNESTKEIFKTETLPQKEAIMELTQKPLPFFDHLGTDEFKELFQVLRENSKPTSTFLTLMVLSTMLATIGLFANSIPVVIGAMILAPLMSPIIPLSMGVLRQDFKMMKDSLKTIFQGVCYGLLIAVILSFIIPIKTFNSEILARTNPTILDLGVAIISGIAGAYAYSKSEVAKSLAGVAIAVALVPPLAVTGIGISWGNFEIFYGSSLLLITNLTGITLASAITFMFLGYSSFTLARKGLFLSLLIVIAISLPLSFSFNRISQDIKIAERLSNLSYKNIRIKDVNIIKHKPLYISATLITKENIDTKTFGKLCQTTRNFPSGDKL